MPAREFAMLVKESSYGVPKATPVLGTDAYVLRLTGGNSFDMQQNPIIGDIPYGGGYNSPACRYSAQVEHKGSLQGEMYYGDGFAKFIADWCLTQVNSGRTTPWVTTDASHVMPPTDLASVSGYRGIQLDDGTYERRRHRGIKVHSGSFTATSQDPLMKYNLQLVGQGDDLNAAASAEFPDATEFPAPTESDYLCGAFLFPHTSGGLKIGSVRTLYGSATISFTNTMDAKYYESKYIVLDKFCGRTITVAVNLYLKKTPDDVASYRSLEALDTELTFDDGVNWLKFDFGTNCAWKGLARQTKIDGVYEYNGTLQVYWDAAANSGNGGDLVITSGVHA